VARDTLRTQCVQIQLAAQILPSLPITNRTHRRQVGMQARVRHQTTDFLDQTLLQHLIKTLRDPYV
jgi:hypothetical protein